MKAADNGRAFVGRGIDRVDARLKVTGKAPFAAEIAVANVAHAVIVTSTIARGRIVAIDSGAAEKSVGVITVLTPKNAPRVPGAKKRSGPIDRVLQLLQDDEVHYQDQPIALVVADTLERAQGAARLVSATYEGEKGVARIEDDLANSYEPAKAGPAGESASKRGDVDAAFEKAPIKIDANYTTPVENHNPMEPHATIAVWQGDDHVTLYDSTQGIFGVRQKVAQLFDLPVDHVRVLSPFVGGGFGCKGSPWSHVGLAVLAAKVTGRAVKIVVTRPQMFSLVGHRPKTMQHVKIGVDSGGKLVAIRHDVISETSRFDEFVEPSAVQTRMLYACPNVATSHRVVRIDIPTPTFQRAPGESTGTFALESALDEIAYASKLDPLELRLRNHADKDPESGKPWSSKSLRECYKRGADAFGWSRRKSAPRSMREGRTLIGLGMATATYPARQMPSSAIARIRKDGSALVQSGTQDIGTGTYTIMTQIAADALAMPIERVRFDLGDTSFPETPVSGGSMTASSTGSAVKMACLALKKKLVETAIADAKSPLHGLAVDAIDADDAAIFSKREPSKRDTYGSIVERSGEEEISEKYQTKEKEDRHHYATHSFGAQFAEVHVDEDFGQVRVARVVGAFAAGKILNAKTARSQFMGGIVWGIGMALLEHTERDARARIVTRDLADYHVPVNADVGVIDVISIDEVDEHVNEIGAKGIGEIGITGIAAAIANAVFHATGKRIRDLPITPDKIL